MRWILAVAVAVVAVAPAGAQQGLSDSATVVAGVRYAKGGVYRFFFGAHYRDLWRTPVRVPRLDLATFAGGLRPLRKGGGQQTKSLRLAGADGRQYAFRSVDKDPSIVLPEGLRETFADRVFQDQISSGHPVGAVVANPILTAAGVLHATPVLVLMPDTEALGEFRAEFANVLGLLEERPRDSKDDEVSFAGAAEIVSTEDLLDAVENDPSVRVDSREFLLARLTDVFLGDWDRHQDQWRWARFSDARGMRWVPIPRDRDQAFVRFDGFLLSLVRQQVPQLVNFGPGYSDIEGATWNGRDLDRQLLTDLERPVWDSVAAVLESRITDQVLDEAVAALPAEYRAIDGPRLREGLGRRRDGIRRMADRYYEHLAGVVDVYATDRDEVAEVLRRDGSSITVQVRQKGQATPYYQRTFVRSETGDVRLYLRGGDDSVHVSGDGTAGITVRAIGGGSDDRFVVLARAGRTRLYDDRGTNSAVGASINTRSYQAVDDTTNPLALPHRDWGRRRLSFPVGSVSPDAGVQFGWGGRFTTWGFRKKPYKAQFSYRATVATGGPTGRLGVSVRTFRENSRTYVGFDALASGVEVVRWHGFGNERPIDLAQAVSYYRVTQHQFVLAPSFGRSSGVLSIEAGPRFKYAVTELDDGQNATRFIGLNRPYGAGNFAQLGLGGSLVVDSRDTPGAARRGWLLEAGGSLYPSLLDVERTFGEVHASAATYLSVDIPTYPTLALQVGGKKVFAPVGAVPFHEAAFLGSGSNLRGFRRERFAGDAAVHAAAELRLQLADAFILVPGRQGVFGFVDGGRVYLRGEESSTWHSSVGGGVWLAFLTQRALVSAGIGHSVEGNRLHIGAGFGF